MTAHTLERGCLLASFLTPLLLWIINPFRGLRITTSPPQKPKRPPWPVTEAGFGSVCRSRTLGGNPWPRKPNPEKRGLDPQRTARWRLLFTVRPLSTNALRGKKSPERPSNLVREAPRCPKTEMLALEGLRRREWKSSWPSPRGTAGYQRASQLSSGGPSHRWAEDLAGARHPPRRGPAGSSGPPGGKRGPEAAAETPTPECAERGVTGVGAGRGGPGEGRGPEGKRSRGSPASSTRGRRLPAGRAPRAAPAPTPASRGGAAPLPSPGSAALPAPRTPSS